MPIDFGIGWFFIFFSPLSDPFTIITVKIFLFIPSLRHSQDLFTTYSKFNHKLIRLKICILHHWQPFIDWVLQKLTTRIKNVHILKYLKSKTDRCSKILHEETYQIQVFVKECRWIGIKSNSSMNNTQETWV